MPRVNIEHKPIYQAHTSVDNRTNLQVLASNIMVYGPLWDKRWLSG